MKNKILLIVVICVLGVFWDDIAMRVAHLEEAGKEYVLFGQRIKALEMQEKRIAVLEDELRQARLKLDRVNPLSARLNMMAKHGEVMEQFITQTVLLKMGSKIFRTAQDSTMIEAASIGSHPAHQNVNWGGQLFLRVGGGDSQNIGRTLIKFDQLTWDLFKGKEILAAVLYLKQMQTDNLAEDDAAVNETINVYAVRKKWEQGKRLRGQADQGQLTWLAARTGEENWAVAGCGSELEDYEPLILATSGPAVSGDALEWVPLVFTPEGIVKLRVMLKDGSAAKYGFILRSVNESKPNSMLSFYSSVARYHIGEYPYVEIYYTDEPSAVEK